MKLSSRFIGGLLGVIICSTVLYRSSHGAAAAAAAAAAAGAGEPPAISREDRERSVAGDRGGLLKGDTVYFFLTTLPAGINVVEHNVLFPGINLKELMIDDFERSKVKGIFEFEHTYGMGIPGCQTYLYLGLQAVAFPDTFTKGSIPSNTIVACKRAEIYSEIAYFGYCGGRSEKYPFRHDLQERYNRYLRYTGRIPASSKDKPMTEAERTEYKKNQQWIVLFSSIDTMYYVDRRTGIYEPYDGGNPKHTGKPYSYAPYAFEWMDDCELRSRTWFYNYQAPSYCTIQ